jgi:hypothetical protein
MRNPLNLLSQKVREMSRGRRMLLFVAAFVCCFAVLGWLTQSAPKHKVNAVPQFQTGEFQTNTPQTDESLFLDADKRKDLQEQLNGRGEARPPAAQQLLREMPLTAPLIAHTAQLAVATKEFARSRSSLEEILERHRGYAARLRMTGRRSGSLLSATLRIPSPELSAAVSELKSLGDVEQEEQSADEVTQQRADLEARLSNAQATLRRFEELLKKQTYPDGNVRELQRQIASASAEVNRLEAERLASEHRVIFANVQFSLREEISRPAETLGSQLHAAAAAGFGQAAASISAILLFFIGRGPVVLLWMAILYLPTRYAWRRLAATAAAPVAQA